MDNRVATPPGELIAADGTHFHIRRFGDSGPHLLLESGMTMMSGCFGWIGPALGQFARVIAYDRAGLGWSTYRDGPRDSAQVAQELRALLATLDLPEPLILVGHSMGALFNRAFYAQNRQAVAAMIWLDPSHPDQMKRRGIRRRIRHLVFYIEAAQLLATKSVPAIEIPLVRHLNGLPPADYASLRHFLRNPTHLRTCAREARAWERSAAQASSVDLASLPLLLISGQKSALPHWADLQRDLARRSNGARHVTFPEMSHLSMLAHRPDAERVVAEIRSFLEKSRL